MDLTAYGDRKYRGFCLVSYQTVMSSSYQGNNKVVVVVVVIVTFSVAALGQHNAYVFRSLLFVFGFWNEVNNTNHYLICEISNKTKKWYFLRKVKRSYILSKQCYKCQSINYCVLSKKKKSFISTNCFRIIVKGSKGIFNILLYQKWLFKLPPKVSS